MIETAKIKKKERLVSLLKDVASSFIRREVDPEAMVTVIRVEVAGNAQSVKFLVSVFPEKKEKEVVKTLNKNSGKFKEYLKTKIRMKFLPNVYFEVEKGWKLEMEMDKFLPADRQA